MEKEVLLSVKPQYANLLVDGIKTVELRKKFPLDLAKGTKIYIYSSYPEKMVIGECCVENVEQLNIKKLWKIASIRSMISWESFKKYYEGHKSGVAISVNKAKRYDRPIKLEKVNPEITKAPQSYRYLPQAI